jgi:hypothetical protein
VTCPFCDSANYLPDALWQKLRPVPRARPFFLVCEYDEASRLRARWALTDLCVRDAEGASLTPAQYAELAGDPRYRVRLAVAANPRTPAAALAALLDSDDSGVVEAAAHNPSLPTDAVVKLSESDGYRHKEWAAVHPNLPHVRLRELARDDSRAVRLTARERIQELEAAGVEVGGKRGLLARLFGR